MEFLIENKELLIPVVLSVLYLAEKLIKQSKLEQNDILIDMIIKPLISLLSKKK